MKLEMRPHATAEEQAAIAAALRKLSGTRGGGDAYRSGWRLAGVLENVDADVTAPLLVSATGPPRSTRGAIRA